MFIKMLFWRLIYFTQLFIVLIKCKDEEELKSKKLLPYFRRQSEKDLDNLDPRGSKNHQDYFVSFFTNNLNEIFSNNDESEFSVSNLTMHSPNIIEEGFKFRETREKESYPTNMSLKTLSALDPNEPTSSSYEIKKVKHSHMLLLNENAIKKSEQKVGHNQTFLVVSSLPPELKQTSESINTTSGRSCIFCNNVMTEDCSDPENKLIPSIVCEREGDQCYSLHTPFGVIDRGCFNVNHNLTIYVCACNLCNYISIMEMPYVFSNKREWARNVVELSRTRNLRESVFKDMACLSCEVNATIGGKRVTDDQNCLEGNVGNVPAVVCDAKEICAVKAIKAEGYIWRGCVRTPLYNYWWAVCDGDLCNYDSLVWLYDYI